MVESKNPSHFYDVGVHRIDSSKQRMPTFSQWSIPSSQVKCKTGIIPPKSSHLYPVPSLHSVPGLWPSFPFVAGAATSRTSFHPDKRWHRGNAALRGQQQGEKKAQSSGTGDRLPLPSPERKQQDCLWAYAGLFLFSWPLPSPHLLPPTQWSWKVGRIMF